ncbi:hypothetical protein CDAR_43791 [Caerostris darwini]|uniref:Uncharacterized protein n=1 Tax=Caerostris darwini TaxID=1538125 RepID=A0AAV4WHY2_9ARAC|nr:hypothetical protein CDAR_43791 [Caerostris darwini]
MNLSSWPLIADMTENQLLKHYRNRTHLHVLNNLETYSTIKATQGNYWFLQCLLQRLVICNRHLWQKNVENAYEIESLRNNACKKKKDFTEEEWT